MARLALYRKYRPQNFDELYGQNHIATTLKNSIKSGNFSHAYLFCGPRGTGKTSVARILAKAINCQNNVDGNPDNTCPACQNINNEKSMDIIEIDAASHTQVDNIREIIVERANFAPTNLKYKVYIIDEAHMLSKSSFNALLKTLEEPPPHAIFILATTEVNKIIPTVVSRCQRFDFRRISIDDIVKRLEFIAKEEKIDLEEGILELVAKASEGGFRDAISLVDQIASIGKDKILKKEVETILGLSDNKIVEDMVYAISRKNQSAAFELIHQLTEEGIDPKEFSKSLTEYLRKLMLASLIGFDEVAFSRESVATAKEVLSEYKVIDIIKTIDTLIQNENLYRTSSIPYLGLEIFIAKICYCDDEPTASEDDKSVSKEIKPKVKDKVVDERPTLTEKVKSIPAEKKEAGKNIDEVKWQELLLEVKSKNNSIHAFLKVCSPEFTDGSFALSFPYQFHKDRIEEPKNRQIVENALSKVYGKNFKVKCKIKPEFQKAQATAPKRDDLLVDALEIFGGEVVE